jgi:hypothetical protein
MIAISVTIQDPLRNSFIFTSRSTEGAISLAPPLADSGIPGPYQVRQSHVRKLPFADDKQTIEIVSVEAIGIPQYIGR